LRGADTGMAADVAGDGYGHAFHGFTNSSGLVSALVL
jgi:hypothetical protein